MKNILTIAFSLLLSLNIYASNVHFSIGTEGYPALTQEDGTLMPTSATNQYNICLYAVGPTNTYFYNKSLGGYSSLKMLRQNATMAKPGFSRMPNFQLDSSMTGVGFVVIFKDKNTGDKYVLSETPNGPPCNPVSGTFKSGYNILFPEMPIEIFFPSSTGALYIGEKIPEICFWLSENEFAKNNISDYSDEEIQKLPFAYAFNISPESFNTASISIRELNIDDVNTEIKFEINCSLNDGTSQTISSLNKDVNLVILERKSLDEEFTQSREINDYEIRTGSALIPTDADTNQSFFKLKLIYNFAE